MTLSIITINYNNRAGLQRTIDSVVCQTWKDYEWIVIDGGSTDGSKELIEQYQDRLAYWCSEPDKGIYNAMNKGVEHAHGDYVNFMNSGDCYAAADVLEKAFSVPQSKDIITGQVIRSDNGEWLRKYDDNLLIQVYTDTINHQGSFIKRELFKDKRYDENLKIVSDWKFWVETIILGDANVQVINDVVAIQDMEGISVENGVLLLSERRKVLDELMPHSLQCLFKEYSGLKKTTFYLRLDYLKHNNPFIFALIRKLAAFFLLLQGVTKQKLCTTK